MITAVRAYSSGMAIHKMMYTQSDIPQKKMSINVMIRSSVASAPRYSANPPHMPAIERLVRERRIKRQSRELRGE